MHNSGNACSRLSVLRAGYSTSDTPSERRPGPPVTEGQPIVPATLRVLTEYGLVRLAGTSRGLPLKQTRSLPRQEGDVLVLYILNCTLLPYRTQYSRTSYLIPQYIL